MKITYDIEIICDNCHKPFIGVSIKIANLIVDLCTECKNKMEVMLDTGKEEG